MMRYKPDGTCNKDQALSEVLPDDSFEAAAAEAAAIGPQLCVTLSLADVTQQLVRNFFLQKSLKGGLRLFNGPSNLDHTYNFNL